MHPIRKSRVPVRLLAVPAGLAVAGGVAWATAVGPVGVAPEPVPEPARTLVGIVWTVDTENSTFVLRDDAEAHHTVRTNEDTAYFLGEEEAERSQVIVLDARVTAALAGTGDDEVATRVTREPPKPDAPAAGG